MERPLRDPTRGIPMAGEARITYGVGYSFDAAALDDPELILGIETDRFFSSELLYLLEPFHGAPDQRFAVLARSTVRSGDPQEWDYSYGIQPTPKLTVEEFEAFARLHAGLQKHYPALAATVSELGAILSVTADM